MNKLSTSSYAIVPMRLFLLHLPANSYRLYGYLRYRSDVISTKSNHVVNVTNQEITEVLGIGDNKISKYLNILQAHKAITIKQTKKPIGGGGWTNTRWISIVKEL